MGDQKPRLSRSIEELARTENPDDYKDLTEAMKSLLDAEAGDTGKLTERLGKGVATIEELRLAADLIPPTRIPRAIGRPVDKRDVINREMARKFLLLWLQTLMESGGLETHVDEGFDSTWTLDNITKQTQKYFGEKGLSRSSLLSLKDEVERDPVVVQLRLKTPYLMNPQ
jgi:hypothetical protein